MSKAYYNEFDPRAAAWLRELIREGLLPDGEVDERDLREVKPADVRGFDQCHFFAGIGGWPHALRLAGWPDGEPVWTGSCPCQPFSAAGKRKGAADERHLWPAWFALIRECRPDTIFGEQVASADALDWLDGVRTDLEGTGYAVGAADLCAAGVGAPHIRQRLWWVADADLSSGHGRRDAERAPGREQPLRDEGAGFGRLADPSSRGQRIDGRAPGLPGHPDEREQACGVGESEAIGRTRQQLREEGRGSESRIETSSFWSNYDLIPCRDGKARRVEPGTFPLAHGIPGRVGLLRGYGNAIVPQVAAEFVAAYLECRKEIAE